MKFNKNNKIKILITTYYFQHYNSNYNNILLSASKTTALLSALRHFNAHPQSLGPLNLFLKFTCYFGCCVMCVLLCSPSGEW